MKINLTDKEVDLDIEIVYGDNGSCVVWNPDDVGNVSISDSNGKFINIGAGDEIDRLIEALEIVREHINDQ